MSQGLVARSPPPMVALRECVTEACAVHGPGLCLGETEHLATLLGIHLARGCVRADAAGAPYAVAKLLPACCRCCAQAGTSLTEYSPSVLGAPGAIQASGSNLFSLPKWHNSGRQGGQRAARLSNGYVYYVGGNWNTEGITYIFDPISNTTMQGARLNVPRQLFGLAAFNDTLAAHMGSCLSELK